MFPDPGQRPTAIGIWITSFSAGGAIGPVLGGVLLEHFWWGSVFLLAVPVMALLLALGPRVLPEYKDPAAGRLDLVSAAMSLVAVLAVVFGLKLTAQDGFGGPAGAAILVGLVVGLLFARRQLTLADPMIDLRLFQSTAFNASLATNLLGIFIAVGYFLFVAQYLQLVLGLSPLEAGLWSLPSAVGFIVGSNLAPRILRRVRPAPVIGVGLAMAAVGLAVLTQVGGSHDADLAILAGASLVVSLGLAPVFTATTDLIVSSAPPERAGAASGISETGSELGGALGIAILGSIGVAVYRGALADTLPADLPAQAAAAAGTPWAAPSAWPRSSRPSSARRAGRGPGGVRPGPPADGRPQRRGRGRHRRPGHGPAPGRAGRRRGREPPSGRAAPRPPSRRPSSCARMPSRSSGRAPGCMACPGESRLEDVHGA